MFEEKITFDRVARWGIAIALSAAAVWLVNRLSMVLLPFFAAWLLSYMLYPLVHFLQYKLRLRNRVLSILVAFTLVLGVIGGTLALIIPPIVQESLHIAELVKVYFNDTLIETGLMRQLEALIRKNAEGISLIHLAQQSSFMEALENVLLQLWGILSGTINFALGLLGFIGLIIALPLTTLLLSYYRRFVLKEPPTPSAPAHEACQQDEATPAAPVIHAEEPHEETQSEA